MSLPKFVYSAPLISCLIISSLTNAAKPLALDHTPFNHIQSTFQVQFPKASLTNSTAINSLHYLKQHTDKKLIQHIRMQQYYAGYLVFGGYAIMHRSHNPSTLAKGAAVTTMTGRIYEDLSVELGAPKASFSADAALALQHFKKPYSNNLISQEEATPMVYVDEQSQAHWAYKVCVFFSYKDKIPEKPCAIVDAKTNIPFVHWNDIKTMVGPVRARGFGGNQKIGEYEFGRDYPFLEIIRDDQKQICFMENQDVRVVDMAHQYLSKTKAMEFPCIEQPNKEPIYYTGYLNDGYDRNNGAESPTNDALYAGYAIKKMYQEWYGVDALTQPDGRPMQLIMRVHYGDGYENAYWDGKQMTFGDGDEIMYPLVSLGISGHEVSHGFTEQHSGLAYFGQPGGMNEAFSDMAAQATEYYATGKATWQIGGEIMKEESGYEALRYMDMPSRDGHSIDTADDYYGGMDVHHSSGVYNHLFYILAHLPGWDVRKAFSLMVTANVDYWTPYSNFDEGGCGLLLAAQDLELSLLDVIKSLEEVGIEYRFCTLP